MPDTPAAASPPHSDVIVYTAPDCSQCHATMTWLKAHHIPFGEIDASPGTEAAQLLIDEGFSSMPVVAVVDRGMCWAGFRIDKLKTLLR